MSVVEIGALHARYVRLTDRFKSLWTYHQFASGVYKNLLAEAVPYSVDFRKIYEHIKGISLLLNGAQRSDAQDAIAVSELALDRATTGLLRADDRISASLLRRFFEKLKRQDDAIIHHLIKFYLYASATEEDCRDKLDFLFTRIGEGFRDSLEFRQQIIALVAIVRGVDAPQEEVVRLIRTVRGMRDEIAAAAHFEELTGRSLLKNGRTFKHRIGARYFHPDVLLAIVELNVATRSRFRELYSVEEQRLVVDAEKLMEHGSAIERNFGGANPELAQEIARFRETKHLFDEARAQSNVKHDVITQLKASMTNILAQLDRGLTPHDDEPQELPAAFFAETRDVEAVKDRFGANDVLLPFLSRIAAALAPVEDALPPEEIAELPVVRELRLEPWEIAAHQKLFDRRAAEADEDDELWTAFLRAAALRLKVDEEATILATAMAASVRPEPELLTRAKASLDLSKQLDEVFGDFLHEAVYYSNPKILHQLYRSRFRLLRGFSGLWLIYDRQN